MLSSDDERRTAPPTLAVHLVFGFAPAGSAGGAGLGTGLEALAAFVGAGIGEGAFGSLPPEGVEGLREASGVDVGLGVGETDLRAGAGGASVSFAADAAVGRARLSMDGERRAAAPSFDAHLGPLPLGSVEGVPGREDMATLSREAVVWMEAVSLSRSFAADAAVGRERLMTDGARFAAAPSLDVHLAPDFMEAESEAGGGEAGTLVSRETVLLSEVSCSDVVGCWRPRRDGERTGMPIREAHFVPALGLPAGGEVLIIVEAAEWVYETAGYVMRRVCL